MRLRDLNSFALAAYRGIPLSGSVPQAFVRGRIPRQHHDQRRSGILLSGDGRQRELCHHMVQQWPGRRRLGIYAQQYRPREQRLAASSASTRPPPAISSFPRWRWTERRLCHHLVQQGSGRRRVGRLCPAIHASGSTGRWRVPCQHRDRWRPGIRERINECDRCLRDHVVKQRRSRSRRVGGLCSGVRFLGQSLE